jgi:hypothetical protein
LRIKKNSTNRIAKRVGRFGLGDEVIFLQIINVILSVTKNGVLVEIFIGTFFV